METKRKNFESRSLPGDLLPPEFRKFDKPFGFEQHIFNIIFIVISHIFAVYWLFYLFPLGYVPRLSIAWWLTCYIFAGLGISVGAHRYWTHRSFKANLPLQVFLMIMQTGSVQYPIFKWCRDHRLHHKYTDTMADPHSSERGFWFSHILWILQPKHSDCVKALETIEISDMARDPVIRFQSKYYWELVLLSAFILPMGIAHLLFPEMSWAGLFCGNAVRYIFQLHTTFLVNSVAHKYGDKPYDKEISSVQNKFVSIFSVGEGWHNYHHAFPWDYSVSEFGNYINLGTIFIHFFAWIGWAWDLKVVSKKMLKDRINRTGDCSHPLHDHNTNYLDEGDTTCRNIWGWGDERLKEEDVAVTETRFPGKDRRG